MKTPDLLILSLLFITVFNSCQSAQEKAKEDMMNRIDSAWILLEESAKQPDKDLEIPMGFVLGCSHNEFRTHCDSLIKMNGGHKERIFYYIKTTVFGNVEREIRTDDLLIGNNETETSPKTDIKFYFDEFRKDNKSNGGWERLRDSISNMFDDSWYSVDFDLNAVENVSSTLHLKKYYKYWVRDNIAVEFSYDGYARTLGLAFFNMPQYGVQSFKNKINSSLEIKENIRKETKQDAKASKIINNAFTGSVWQVKKYIKAKLKDPDSYESIEWSKVIQDGQNYKVRHKYRAKNSFGGFVVEEWMFTLDENGNVINAIKM